MDSIEELKKSGITIPDNVEITEPMRIYFEEVCKVPVLSKEEERSLLKECANGNVEAQTRLQEQGLRQVISMAGLYAGCGLPFMDLIQEGNIGLMEAVMQYDHTVESNFHDYASTYIWQAITEAVQELTEEIKVPAYVAETMQKIKDVKEELKNASGEEPSAVDIAKKLKDKTVEEVEDILRLMQDPSMLENTDEEKENKEEQKEEEQMNAADAAIASLIRQEEINELLSPLTETEQQVIKLRFGIAKEKPYSPEETGKELHLSAEEVEKLEKKAMKKLRKSAKEADK